MWFAVKNGVKLLFFTEQEAVESELEYEKVPEEHPDYIDIYHPIAGWKSIQYSWEVFDWDEAVGMAAYTPSGPGFFGFKSAMIAYHDAWEWAEAEDKYLVWYSEAYLRGVKDHDEATEGMKATLDKLFR